MVCYDLFKEYKKNCNGFNLKTRVKWPTQGQDAKKDATLSWNVQQYSFKNIVMLGQNAQAKRWFGLCSNFVA